MKRLFQQLIFVALLSLIIVTISYAVPIYSKDVFCSGDKCGTMEIDTKVRKHWSSGQYHFLPVLVQTALSQCRI